MIFSSPALSFKSVSMNIIVVLNSTELYLPWHLTTHVSSQKYDIYQNCTYKMKEWTCM